MKRKKIKHKDEQPYNVGKPFIKWLESQMKMNLDGFCDCETTALKREQETYQFIREIVKP